MASSIIHMCVANELANKLNVDRRQLLIGSIAPDISKHLGKTKKETHFLDEYDFANSIPVLEKFLSKYQKNLDDPFVLGYYIHLYTDYIWFRYFIKEFCGTDCIYNLDGSVKKLTEAEVKQYIYNDFTNMNILLIEKYNLELTIFYLEMPEIKDIIKEIPMDKIIIIIDQAGLIVKNSTYDKLYTFKITEIEKFITRSIDVIYEDLKKYIDLC